MTSTQIVSILQAILSALGGFVLAKGWVNADTWAWLTGGVLTIGPTIWSWASTRPASIAAQAQAIPGVTVNTTAAAPQAVITAVANAKSS